MYLIHVSKTTKPCQIDFGNDIKRSCKGSLHFKPNATKQVTQDELEYIKMSNKELYKSITIVSTFESKDKITATPKRAKDKKSASKLRAEFILKNGRAPKEVSSRLQNESKKADVLSPQKKESKDKISKNS